MSYIYIIKVNHNENSLMDCMEVLSKGIHRVLVPLDSDIENISGPELVESASAYALLTQMDLISFFLHRSSDLQGILSRTVTDLSAIHDTVLALTSKVIYNYPSQQFSSSFCRILV